MLSALASLSGSPCFIHFISSFNCFLFPFSSFTFIFSVFCFCYSPFLPLLTIFVHSFESSVELIFICKRHVWLNHLLPLQACQLPLMEYLAERMCSLCYERAWYAKLGGCIAIKFLVERMAMRWVYEHLFLFLTALLFVMMDLTGEVQ